MKEAFDDADVLLYMVEPGMKDLKDDAFYRKIENSQVPVFLIINKIDTIDQKTLEETVAYWHGRLPVAEIFPLSALEKFGVENLLSSIVEALPEGPAYYPKDSLTDKPERFFVNEIIRQKILLNYKKEVPYSVEVETEEFLEEQDIIRIRAVICRTAEPARDIDRPQGQRIEKGRYAGSHGHRKILRQESVPRNFCKG